MKAMAVVKALTKRIPSKDQWVEEAYGGFGINPMAEINKILYCVTPTEEVQKKFKSGGYDLLVSHHPFVVKGIPMVILHTALDCCDGGLNDQWADLVKIQDRKHFDDNLGWYGLVEPISFADLLKKVDLLSGDIVGQIYHPGNDLIRSVVVCSGLGGMVLWQARQTGADCYITGEMTGPAERSGFRALIEIGHTRSEWMGIKLIRDVLGPSVLVDYAGFDIDRFGSEVYGGRR